jgi:uncharacterized protein (TIGR02271 family)
VSTTHQDALSWRGETLADAEGDKIGTNEEIYLDAETDQPEWALVSTGLFGGKQSFVPITDATTAGGDLRVPFTKATVKDAPRIDPDGRLSREEERALYQHYGREYGAADTGSGVGDTSSGVGDTSSGVSDTRSGVSDTRTGVDDGHDVSGPTTDDAMTLSEEELRVGTTERETGRVRLKKYVVEDQVTETVPVRREEVRLEREPITDANVDDALDGPAISEEEHEVVLHAEEPVVDKRAVPKERVRLEKDVTTDEREVSGTVRSEHVDVNDSRR